MRPEELLDRIGGADLAAVAAAENLVEGFQGSRHFEIGELRAEPLSQGLARGFARATHASPPAASAAYASRPRRSTGTCGSTGEVVGRRASVGSGSTSDR